MIEDDVVTWEQLADSESAFYSLKGRLYDSGRVVPELRSALGSAKGAGMALRFLRDGTDGLLAQLLPEVLEQAMTTDKDVELSRQLLSRADPFALIETAGPVATKLASDPAATDYDYRKIFDVLQIVGDLESIRRLHRLALDSQDPYKREFADEIDVRETPE